MKKRWIVLLLICPAFLFSAAQTRALTGNWVAVDASTLLPLVFHITRDSANEYKATWDSPLQGAMGLKCQSVSFVSDSLHIATAGINAHYNGVFLPGKDSIYGTWSQNGSFIRLDFKRMLRPQTPEPPFPYYSDSVEYDNTDKTVHLGATLTIPWSGTGAGVGADAGARAGSSAATAWVGRKSPVVILITGSGLQDRDETIFWHRPFAVLADYLTKRGIAVLRVDDRTKGKSAGDVKNATSADYAEDVITSLRYLRTRKDIDTARIGLIGHSEGGIIAPMVAARQKGIAFVVLWGAPAAGGEKINIAQNSFQLKKMNIGDTAIRAFGRLHASVLGQFKMVRSKKELDSLIDTIFAKWRSGQDSNTLRQLRVKGDALLGQNVHQFYAPLYLSPWLRFFITYDPMTDLTQVNCPILAFNGSKDTQVEAADNIPLIAAAAKRSNNPDCTTIIMPGLNHLLQKADTGDLTEYLTLNETISPAALQTIGDWIVKRVGTR